MNCRVSPLFWLLACLLVVWSIASAQKAPGTEKAWADVESRRTTLHSLFDEEWQYELRSDPETATSLGDKRYNDRLSATILHSFTNLIPRRSASSWRASRRLSPRACRLKTRSAGT